MLLPTKWNCGLAGSFSRQSASELENQFAPEPPLPLATAAATAGVGGDQSRSNGTEVCATNVCVRIVKVRRIGNSEGACFKLEGEALRKFKIPHEAHI